MKIAWRKNVMDAVKELWFLEGNIYIPSDGDGSKSEIYCIKCYDKKTKERTH